MFTFNTIWRHRIIARRLAAEGAPLAMSKLAPTFAKTVGASVVMVLVIQLMFVAPRAGAGFVNYVIIASSLLSTPMWMVPNSYFIIDLFLSANAGNVSWPYLYCSTAFI